MFWIPLTDLQCSTLSIYVSAYKEMIGCWVGAQANIFMDVEI